jgi:hypothetical protein
VLRYISFNIQVKIPIGLYYASGEYAANAVRQALENGGFIVNNVNVISENVSQWFYLTAVAQAESNISAENLRQYAANLISNHKSAVNYGLFTGTSYNTFEAVDVTVINEQSIPKTINYNDIGQGGLLSNLTESLGLGKQTGDNVSKEIATGLQISTPILIGAGVVFLLLYLKK